jgi:hypothetical protein
VRNRRLFITFFLFLLSVSQLGFSQTPGTAYNTAFNYVVTFYPRWFTYHQFRSPNRLVAPVRISPIYHAVVAINVDTAYASASFYIADEPVIVTIPSTTTMRLWTATASRSTAANTTTS